MLIFLAYALVLAHGIVPHQHLHLAVSHAQQHSHHSHHSHGEERDKPAEEESPFSHYFHSAAQGEPHICARTHGSIGKLLADAESEAFAEPDLPSYVLIGDSQERALHKVDFSPPPHFNNLPQRGPPVT